MRTGNSAGKLGPGIDTRGQDGYTLIPPSVHPSGAAYRWADFSQVIAPVPDWLLRLLTISEPVKARPDIQRSTLSEGWRNDALMRLAGSMRRKGAGQTEIEGALLDTNRRRCFPPLTDSEVCAIAKSAAGYAVGGPDVLEAAVEAIEEEPYRSHTDRFHGLCAALQRLRGTEAVVLPVERIAAAFACHWTLIARLRRQGVTQGWLIPERKAIAHRQAARFFVLSDTGGNAVSHYKENEEANETKVEEQSLSDTRLLSETRNESVLSETGAASVSFPRCPTCGSFALYRNGNAGPFECLTCERTGISEEVARSAVLPLDASIFNLERVQ